jgi:hypothetical protein
MIDTLEAAARVNASGCRIRLGHKFTCSNITAILFAHFQSAKIIILLDFALRIWRLCYIDMAQLVLARIGLCRCTVDSRITITPSISGERTRRRGRGCLWIANTPAATLLAEERRVVTIAIIAGNDIARISRLARVLGGGLASTGSSARTLSARIRSWAIISERAAPVWVARWSVASLEGVIKLACDRRSSAADRQIADGVVATVRVAENIKNHGL